MRFRGPEGRIFRTALFVWKGVNCKIFSLTPVERVGKPEEVASAVLFLRSEAASFSTGKEIVTAEDQGIHTQIRILFLHPSSKDPCHPENLLNGRDAVQYLLHPILEEISHPPREGKGIYLIGIRG